MDAATLSNPPLAAAVPTAARHLRLALLRSVLALLLRATRVLAPLEELLARFPGVHVHLDAAAAAGLEGCTLELAIARLDDRLWPAAGEGLPLPRLRRALGLDAAGIDLLLLCAASDDDPALAPLVDALRGHQGRPTRAFVAGEDGTPPAALRTLLAAGMLRESLEGRWRTYTVPPAVWDAAQGHADGLLPPAVLADWEDLVLPRELVAGAHAAMARHAQQGLCWALAGPAGSGRRALAGALARSHGLGLLPAGPAQDPLELAACATLLGAMPLLEACPPPGERAALPELPWLPSALAVRLPPHAGLAIEGRTPCWLELPLPDRAERERHWRAALQRESPAASLLDLRLPRGRIHTLAAQVGDDPVAVVAEVDAQRRYRLEGLAQRVAAPTPQEALALADELQEEFDLLVARCRHRESLPAMMPAQPRHGGCGVRALFKGPSGTGKTLAARHLAAALGRPLYRVDLAATVSKYIGETERNLERVFAAAEELDVVLVLDEGDALMAARTGVQNANDRYANLETNYLLQRLERYGGVLVVTTNAAERIDGAFARRMDATLDFAAPDAATRHRLWCAHLPPGHRIDAAALQEVALRCALTGGQIRNAALHVALLALESGRAAALEDLARALRREYRRTGQACPSLSLARMP
jgi:hypothetical protein